MAFNVDPVRVEGRKEPHSTVETWGAACDMCPALSCIEQRAVRRPKWRYYCDEQGRTIDPFSPGRCPRGRA